MTPARRLLLVPLLAPLLAVFVLAAVNPAPRLSLRLLIWRSPPLPLGAWLALAASGGGLVSAAAVGLSLGQAGRLSWSERRRPDPVAAWPSGGDGRGRERERDPGRQAESPPAPAARAAPWSEPNGFSAGPSRSEGEPAPTVAVPFRVIQRPAQPVGSKGQAGAHAGRSRTAAVEAPARRQPAPAAPPAAAGEDWGAPPQDDW